MHGAEFLLGLVLIGLDHMPAMIALAIVLGISAALLLRGGRRESEDR